MMQFAQPLFLWALAGLSIPLAIHLLSRKEGKVIQMGSLRHLRETSTQQFRGIKLNEILLLALRSLLIILFVMLLSGLNWSNSNTRWVVVEKGVEANPMAKKMIDSLKRQGYERHVLQREFPLEEAELEGKQNYWQLIASLQQLDISQIVVLSSTMMENFSGLRQAMKSNVQWLTFPAKPNDFIAESIQQASNQFLIRHGHSEADFTSFESGLSMNILPDSITIIMAPSITVIVVNDPLYESDKLILKAALNAVEKELPIAIQIIETSPEKLSTASANWLIWLSDQKIVSHDSIKIMFYEAKIANQFLEKTSANSWRFSKRLTIENARKENLTLQLASLLIDEKKKWKNISHHDRRTLPDSILFKGVSHPTASEASIIPPLNKYIVLLLLAVLIIERILSYQRNQ